MAETYVLILVKNGEFVRAFSNHPSEEAAVQEACDLSPYLLGDEEIEVWNLAELKAPLN